MKKSFSQRVDEELKSRRLRAGSTVYTYKGRSFELVYSGDEILIKQDGVKVGRAGDERRAKDWIADMVDTGRLKRLSEGEQQPPKEGEDKQLGEGEGQPADKGGEESQGAPGDAGQGSPEPEGTGEQTTLGESSEGGEQEVTEEGEVIEEPQRKTPGEMNQDPTLMIDESVVAAMAADPAVSKALRDLAVALANYNASKGAPAQAGGDPQVPAQGQPAQLSKKR